MNCLKCGAPIDLSRPTCASCGTPVDADGNGIPDVLDKLVEKKVSSMLAQAGGGARAPANPAPAGMSGDESRDLHRDLERCQQEIAHILQQPQPRWLLGWPRLLLLLVLSVGIGGVLVTHIVEAIVLDRSLVAASLFCPGRCQGCSGPGRIFTWHVKSTNYEGNVSVQLCTNPQIDISRLSKLDVVHPKADLEPYQLSLWTSFLCNSVLAFAILILIGPLLFAWLRQRSLDSDRRRLERMVARLQARIEQGGGSGWLPR